MVLVLVRAVRIEFEEFHVHALGNFGLQTKRLASLVVEKGFGS